MSLTRKQKSHLWVMAAIILILSFFGGLAYFIFWADETTVVQHLCDGTTGYVISQTNGNGTSVSIKVNDPACP